MSHRQGGGGAVTGHNYGKWFQQAAAAQAHLHATYLGQNPPSAPIRFRATVGILMEAAESDLVRAAQAGDRVAFAELLRPEYRPAFRLAYGLLQDMDEAEDVVQEAAFSAWRRIGNLHEGAAMRPWFLGIVANQSRTVKRSRWWSLARTEPPETEAPTKDMAASIDLRRALRRLGPEERLVLVLRFYLDLPFEDIAATIGTTPKAARTRVERALHRLRPILGPREATL